jgi:hypothetical protein
MSIPNSILRDRENYILYASNYDLIINDRIGAGLFFNEPLFLLINKSLSNFVSADSVPICFVFFNSAILMFILIKKSKNFLMFFLGFLLILFVPYAFQAQLTALRQSLATSVFLLAFLYFKDHWKILATSFLCCFIHSVFFLITALYYLNFFIIRGLRFELKLIINFLVMLGVSFSFLILAQIFKMRQFDVYQDVVSDKGGGGFLLFFIVFIILFFLKKERNKDIYLFVMVGIILFLTGYFISPLSGRLFNTFFPFFVILCVSKFSKAYFWLLLSLSMIYGFLYFNGAYNDILLYNHLNFNEFFSKLELNF